MSELAPTWLMEEIRAARLGAGQEQIRQTGKLLSRLNINTVCESARCPNCGECFSGGVATFLIMGNLCTRNCSFCAVEHSDAPGHPDNEEPERLAQAVNQMGLSHVVITSVTRDDLADGGADQYVRVVETLRNECPDVTIELLVPDFQGNESSLAMVLSSGPDVLAHNMETIPRLYESIRSGASYEGSLNLLRSAKLHDPGTITKSGLMLGLGEHEDEIEAVLNDLADVQCNVLTIGQYLSPSLGHAPVARYVSRDEFDQWRDKALDLGISQVVSAPLVRSSYKASHYFRGLP